MRAAWLLVAAGCYHPAAYEPCQTACSRDSECQPGFVCGLGTGYCRAPGMGDCSPTQDAGTEDGGQICVGQGLVTACLPRAKADVLGEVTTTTSLAFDTNDPQCTFVTQADGPELCVRWFKRFTIASMHTVAVVGPRPLVIAALEDITISGVLDAASRGNQVGAGSVRSPSPLCTTPVTGTVAAGESTSAGGSAGGAFVTSGGGGGVGTGGTAGGPTTAAVASVAFVRGGCNGATGTSSDTMPGALGGNGGGAVYLVAGGTLAVTGQINASGAGGSLPPARTGGAGGGSGGFIGLDAPVYAIDLAARIFASGGSGATGGGADNPGFAGSSATADLDPATTASAEGGFGGNGASSTAGGPGGPGMQGGAGGAGGGGGGYIGVANAPSEFGAPRFRPPATPM